VLIEKIDEMIKLFENENSMLMEFTSSENSVQCIPVVIPN